MELLLDPTMWVGLLTLVVLEIVLGIDNLIFIAILADKLPAAQRDKARIIGLSLALLMRLALLSVVSWAFALTTPLVSIGPFDFSGRDLILILGGFFLVFKGTTEMHERIEGKAPQASGARLHAGFWVIVTQIVVLDAVFSLDAVITAVGMVNQIEIMMAAVIIAVAAMAVASKPLTRLVNAHPTVIVLCLGFLLMIGFALVAEGFGFNVPKGYLYAAIGFAVLIEALNQIARRNLMTANSRRPMRERTAEGIMRMLGKRPVVQDESPETDLAAAQGQVPFGVEERNMVSGVLKLADRSIHSIMTPRTDISWINLDDDARDIEKNIKNTPHGFFPVCRGSLDEIIGIGRAKDMMSDLILLGKIKVQGLRPPIIVHESIPILDLIHTLKRARGQLVIVTDEFGTIEGLVTPIDVFEAIAGDFPDEDEAPDILADGENRWKVDGSTDLHQLEQELEIDGLVNESDDYTTLAGYLLNQFGRLPEPGDEYTLMQAHGHIRFEILHIDGHRIARVRIERRRDEPEAGQGQAA
ncbi:TerC family protein [Paralcaligenes ginsengisoli]